MRLLGLVLALLLACPVRGHAEPFLANAAFDQRMVADVTGAALAFMAPRTLAAVPLAQLTLWGLRGLASLDPRLSAEMADGRVSLVAHSLPAPRLLRIQAAPEPGDVAGWGGLAAEVAQAAWDASQPVRRAGTGGVLEAFFDEICNHLDAYSRYLTPAEAAAERRERAGQAGIGLDLRARGRRVTVAHVLADGPAGRAGIRSGETVVAVDGAPAAPERLDEIQASLSGAEDSAVVLELRDRRGRERTIEVSRSMPAADTVRARIAGRVAVIGISGFAADTAALLGDAVRTAAAGRGVAGLVLDLRANPGGLLREAVAAAETLMPSGLVAVTVGRDPAANHEFEARGQDLAAGLPVVVLVDGGTASAAEVLAAALADQHRAVVVGSATLGKGLVQAVEELPNGGELLLTWSRVLAPLGWPLQGLGVLPQLCTSLGPEETARQVAALGRGEQPMGEAVWQERAARPPVDRPAILQLRAACPSAEGRDADLASARFLIEHKAAYAAALLGPPT